MAKKISKKPAMKPVVHGKTKAVTKKPAAGVKVAAAKAVTAKLNGSKAAPKAARATSARAIAAPRSGRTAATPRPVTKAVAPAGKPASAAKAVAAPLGKAAGKAASVAVVAPKPSVAALAVSAVAAPKRLKSKLRSRPVESAPVRLPPPPVTSNSKMAKNKAGLSNKELELFRDLLLKKRRELLGDMSSMEGEALRSGNTNLSNLPLHMADTGTDNYEQEFTLNLVEKERKLLREIQTALAKIQDGSYGICEGTGKPIGKPRLEAQPWAKYSIEHARQLEKPQYRRAF